jgi:hypothetical protein
MSLCSQVVSKPGDSTFAEACRMNAPVVTIPRDDFAEGPVLTDGIRKYNRHRILAPAEFFEGNWDFLREPPYPPEQPEPLPKDGNEVVAKAIVEYLHSSLAHRGNAQNNPTIQWNLSRNRMDLSH